MESFEDELLSALKTGFIDEGHQSPSELRPNLLVNDERTGQKIYPVFRDELENCKEFAFSVAFITRGGISLLANTLETLREKGVRGRVVTSNYLNFNEPDALRFLLSFPNIDVRIIDNQNMHAKGFIFRRDKGWNIIVGSANLTDTALTSNNE